MCSQHLGSDMVLAWPSAEIAVMGAKEAARIIFRKDIKLSKNPEKTEKTLIDEYKTEFYTPYLAAKRGYVTDVIIPSETRDRIITAIEMLQNKRTRRPQKKHGNMPM